MEQLTAIEQPAQPQQAGLSFKEVVRLRKSCRGFLPTPVPADIITSVLDDARQAPSNCNTQPWVTHLVSGDKLRELSDAILAAIAAGEYSPDFSFDNAEFYGRFGERQRAQGKAYYDTLGVARDDKEGRTAAGNLNYTFFGAPQVALLFMPSFGDNVRVAGDLGMYGQTFLLSLTDHGLAGIPQTSLGFFAAIIRRVLNISDELKLLFGISFGYADPEASLNTIKLGRDPLASNVFFHA
jgi:nitroreductase